MKITPIQKRSTTNSFNTGNPVFQATNPVNSTTNILKHAELKKEVLYDCQIIHRFAISLKIGGLEFLTMITVKERTDSKDTIIDEFAIYDLYSEAIHNKKSSDSPSTVSIRTFRSQYQMTNYSIYDLLPYPKPNTRQYSTTQILHKNINLFCVTSLPYKNICV